jgi:hypothetical protein
MERCRDFPPKVLRWSELSKMRQSPAHMRAAYEEPSEPTAGMTLGLTAHHELLGSADLVVYEGERRGNVWKEFDAEHAGKLIVTSKEHAKAKRIADAVRADKVAAPLLEKALFEVELSWQAFGRACAGRLDIVGPGRIVEFKTTSCAEPLFFQRAAQRMGYLGQLAWYLEGARANGHAIEECWVIAAETAPPFAVTVMLLTPRALLEGHKLARLLVERTNACQESGQWPAYAQAPVPFDVAEAVEVEIDGEFVSAA